MGSDSAMMLLDEHIHPDGRIERIHLAVDLAIEAADSPRIRILESVDERTPAAIGTLTVDIMAAIMRRYARPLERHVHPQGARLQLGCGRALAHLQFRAAVDASSRDYVVWIEPDAEPIGALGRQIAAALRFLVRGADARGSGNQSSQ